MTNTMTEPGRVTAGPATCLQYWLLLRAVTATGAAAMPEFVRHTNTCPLCKRWIATETKEAQP